MNNITFETKNNTLMQLNKSHHPLNRGQIMREFWDFICNKIVIIPTVFILLYMSTPSFSSPIFYFLSNKLDFQPTDFGLISFFSNLFIVIAIFAYRYYLKNYNFKVLIVIASIISFFITLLAYCVVRRYNVAWGISDFFMCLACSTILSALGEIIVLPMLSLGCQLCPPYLEATVYSYFMSTINMGAMISELTGSYLTSYYHITSNDFHNLHKLIVLTNIISILPLVLLFFFDNKYFHPEDNYMITEPTKEDESAKECFIKNTSKDKYGTNN